MTERGREQAALETAKARAGVVGDCVRSCLDSQVKILQELAQAESGRVKELVSEKLDEIQRELADGAYSRRKQNELLRQRCDYFGLTEPLLSGARMKVRWELLDK